LKNSTDAGHIRSFVLRSGRMSNRQKYAYEHFTDRFCIPYTGEQGDLNAWFERSGDLIVEVGFGAGEALLAEAERRREINFVGIEVYKAGIGCVLSEIRSRTLENVKVIEHDAFMVFDRMVPPETLKGVHIFFPDPWPKKKHRKRRLIQPEFSAKAAAALRPGGYICLATDWEDYAEHCLHVFLNTLGLKNRYEKYAPAQEWRIRTRFEEKGLEKKHRIYELFFEKEALSTPSIPPIPPLSRPK